MFHLLDTGRADRVEDLKRRFMQPRKMQSLNQVMFDYQAGTPKSDSPEQKHGTSKSELGVQIPRNSAHCTPLLPALISSRLDSPWFSLRVLRGSAGLPPPPTFSQPPAPGGTLTRSAPPPTRAW